MIPQDDPLRKLAGFGPPTLDPTEVCEVAGVDRETGDRLWRALGYPDVPEGVLAYTDEDARALRLAAEGLDRLEAEERERALQLMLQEARMLSAHLAALAETELDALAALQARGLRTRLLDDAFEQGIAESELGWLIFYALRRQLDAVARQHSRPSGGGDAHEDELAVGFVDLSEFTALSERTELGDLGDLLTRFESLAFDAVAEAGGRVVKLIGDEVMYVCPGAERAVGAALEMLEAGKRARIPPARAGLAYGTVLHKGGDYFGTPVNVASRITHIGEPRTVVVDQAMCGRLRDRSGLDLEPLGERELKGLRPTELWRVRRHVTT